MESELERGYPTARNDQTRPALNDWHGGDQAALVCLLDRSLEWIRKRVAKRMGAVLQAKGETVDYVQDAMVEVLRYGPKFVMTDESQSPALMAKIVENVLRSEAIDSRPSAAPRTGSGAPRDTILDLDPSRKPVTRRSQVYARSEAVELARLGIGLLDDADREVIILRQ